MPRLETTPCENTKCVEARKLRDQGSRYWRLALCSSCTRDEVTSLMNPPTDPNAKRVFVQ